MGAKRRKLSALPRRTGRDGKMLYLYGGKWRSGEVIERERERHRAAYEPKLPQQQRAQKARDRVEAIIAGAGKTMDEIAGELGVSRQYLYELLDDAGARAKARFERARRADDLAAIEVLQEHLKQGRSLSQIASAEGVSNSTIQSRVARLHRKYPDAAPTPAAIAEQHQRKLAERMGDLLRETESYEAIAAAEGISPVTARQRYSRLRQKYPDLMPTLREIRDASA